MAAYRAAAPPAKRGGGKRRVNMREVVNGVMYVLSTGCQLENIHHALYVKCREQDEREASPTACIVDSQSASSPLE
jgi:hypothetical protein